MTDPLSLADLRRANLTRSTEWTANDPLDDLSFRMTELGGETGEALNVAKKHLRHLRGWRGGKDAEQTRPALAEELADVVICADRAAESMGIDLGAAVRAKFNATSLKYGLSTRL